MRHGLASWAVTQHHVHQQQQHDDKYEAHGQISHDLPPEMQLSKQRLQALGGAHAHVEQDVYAAASCSCGCGAYGGLRHRLGTDLSLSTVQLHAALLQGCLVSI